MTPTDWLLRDGFRLAVHDAGGDGRPVLFQHGLGGDAQQCADAFPPDPRLRRVTLECRGHGHSDFDPDPALETFTNDVAALAERFGRPLPVGGISMGAAIALRLALRRSDLVSHLILLRPAWQASRHTSPNLQPNADVGQFMARLPVAEARAAFLQSDTANALRLASPDNLASLTGFFAREPVAQTATLLTSLSLQPLGIDAGELASLNLPVLVCGTAQDVIHPLDLARDMARLIPGARFVDLPPKGQDKATHLHALHNAITTFLSET